MDQRMDGRMDRRMDRRLGRRLGHTFGRVLYAPVMRLLIPGLVILAACAPPHDDGEWVPGPGLKTRWAAQVDPAEPLPEYPRPQMVRDDWTNLNGLWDFAVGLVDEPPPDAFQEKILVPFPVESSLSGVGRAVRPEYRIWYRRDLELGEPSPGTRWLLHFGAVDWETEVFVNGTSLGVHRGGYDPFTFDITDALIHGGHQELTVAVWDPTDQGQQPRGKQVLDPHGIWYTAVTGIWQTVWLEPVQEVHVVRLDIEPDLGAGTVAVTAEAEGSDDPVEVHAVVLRGDETWSEGDGVTGEPLVISVPEARPWSPDDPYLYGLRVSLAPGDQVESYFGMRSIEVREDADGHARLVLNGEPLFQYGLLDQGWWPEGLYTAPTDEALAFDVRQTKELGFNLIRKHVKVEPARWYLHCDEEGVLVWQDMPSGDNETPEAREEFAAELGAMVGSLRNHPAIVMWVPFNEGWGQHDTQAYVGWLGSMDPTRLVDDASGWTDRGVGDVLDVHSYPGPAAPDPQALGRRAAVLGEYGGLGLPLPGHTWVEEENWGYRSFEDLEALNAAYQDLLFQLRPLIGEGLAAAVYTQTTDVEVEVNGIMTYDREVVKLNEDAVAANRQLHEPPPVLRAVVPTSRLQGQPWRYTTEAPPEAWTDPAFDDGSWSVGEGGFGTERTPGARVRTVWDTPQIWLRRTFSLTEEELDALSGGNLNLRVHHDEDAEIYLNGVEIAVLPGYATGYRLVPLDAEAVALLRPGVNLLAAHVRQTTGGQYFDAGLVEWVEPPGE